MNNNKNQSFDKTQYKNIKGFVSNPFDSLYQRDVEPSSEPEIQEFLEIANELEDSISGELESKLDYYTFRLKLNSLAFVEQGLILFKIRAWRLYKKKYSNFTDYCKQEFGRSRSYCDRLIVASRVVLELINNGASVLPSCESQCRILASLAGSELIRVWEAIVKTIEPHKITVESIRNFLSDQQEPEPEPEPETNIPLPDYLERAIYPYASAKGLSVINFVIMLLEEIFQPVKRKANWRDFQKEDDWELDLDKLVEEGESFLNSA